MTTARRSLSALVAALLGATAVTVLTLAGPTVAPAGAAAGVGTGTAGQTLTVSDVDALDPNGTTVTVTGTGFDAEAGFNVSTMGLYLSVCVDQGATALTTPCLGGIDQSGGTASTRWITNNPIGDADVVSISATGSFTTTLRVSSWDENTDCLDLPDGQECKIVTRVDHRGGANRSQDVRVPIAFAAGPRLLLSPSSGFDPDGDDITVRGSGYPTTTPGVYVVYGPPIANSFDPDPYVWAEFLEPVDMAGGEFQVTLVGVQARYTGTNEVDYDFRTGGGFVSTLRAHGFPDAAGDWSASLPVAFDRRTANESFVTAARTDFLGTEPTDAQVAAGVTQLGQKGKTGYLQTLSTSDEWLRALVNGFYQNTLGRDGSPQDVAFWVAQIRNRRRSVAQVAATFYASPEYYNGQGGGTNGTWVDDLYQELLGRASDPSGRAYWVSQIAVRGRGGVALGFYQSNESGRDRVAALYQKLLGRGTDAAGLAFWTPRVLAQGDLVLAVSLASSPEYANRAITRFP